MDFIPLRSGTGRHVTRASPVPTALIAAALLVSFAALDPPPGTFLAASAQSDVTFQQADGTQPTLYLHIPSKMIAGQTYQGVAVSSEPAGLSSAFSSGDRLVHLASGSPAIELPATSIEIPLGKNHAVFTVHAVQSGVARVHAAYGGLVGLAIGTVYSQSTGPHMLDIVSPGSITSAPDMLAFVYLKDTNGYPVRAPAGGVDVRLVGGGLVETVRGMTIPYNASSAPIPLRVSGDGYVSAAAPGLRGDTEHIAHVRDDIRVRLEVAPDIVLPGGRVHYAVWLEREASELDVGTTTTTSTELPTTHTITDTSTDSMPNTLPYHPSRAIAAELQTTDTDVLRLTEHIPSNKKEGGSAAITLHGGRATGILYAGHASAVPAVPTASSLRSGADGLNDDGGGIAVLTVSVPGYGVASAYVCVGTVVTGTTTTETYAKNGTNIVRGPDGNYLAVEGVGGGDGGEGSESDSDSESGQEQDDTSPSCGSGTETFAAYAERTVRQSVEESLQQGSGPSGIISLPRELTREPEANHIRLFLQPSTVTPLSPYSEAHGVVGFYYVDRETPESAVLESEDLVITTSTEYERIMPIRAEYERITITAASAPGSERGGGGLDVRPLHVSHPTFHTNAYEFPLRANLEGTYDVSAVSGGHTQNSTLNVVPHYETGYHLDVTALPARSGDVAADGTAGEHPLFLVSIIDDAGRIIDVHEEFGEPRTVRAVFLDSSISSVAPTSTFADASVIREAEIGDFNAAVIYGPVYDGGAGVIITLEGWPPASAPYEGRVLPVDAPVSMELDAPALVHAGEYFPVTTHTVDSAGVPVELVAESDRRDTGFAQAGGGTGLVEDEGTVLLSSLYDVGGAVQREVFSFLNVMSVDVEPGVPDMVKAGEPFELRAESLTVPTFRETGDGGGTGDVLDAVERGLPVPDVSYELDVPPGWSAEQMEPGVFTVYPGTEGEFDLVVSGHRDGFGSEPATITITSEMSVKLTVDAVLQDGGAAVSIPFTIQNGTSYDTPFRAELSNPEYFEFGFPESFEGGYGLVDVTYGGGTISPGGGVGISAGDRLVNVTAVYDRQVEIVVLGSGSSGSGTYQYGQTVVAAANPGHVIPYLVPEKVSYWQGVPDSVPGGLHTEEIVSFRAESDAVIEPVFEPDYTRMYLVVVAGAAVAGVVAYRRFAPVASYKLGGLIDSVRSRGGDDEEEEEGGGGGDEDDDEDYEDYDDEGGGSSANTVTPPAAPEPGAGANRDGK